MEDGGRRWGIELSEGALGKRTVEDGGRMIRNAAVLSATMLATFGLLRILLYFTPNSDFGVGQYNIHHLFLGLLLITAAGVPLALFNTKGRRRDMAVGVFGVGLAMALDEWVYLIATDGSNVSYLLPVSFWGGVVVVGLALAYVGVLSWWNGERGGGSGNRES